MSPLVGVYVCPGAGTLTNAKAMFFPSIFVPIHAAGIIQRLMQVPTSAFPSDISLHCY